MNYEFSEDKNRCLLENRALDFREVIKALNEGRLLETIDHYNIKKYPNQRIYIIDIDGYVYLVPFVRKNRETVFLKTLFPSRKLTKQYLTKKVQGE